MSADKYAQFIAEQQRKLSVSGVNAVEVTEKKELSPKQKKIAAQAGDPEKIEGEDFAKLRAQKEEVEQVDEVSRQLAVKTLGMRMAQGREGVFGDDVAASKADATETRVKKKFGKSAVTSAEKIAHKELYGEEAGYISIEEQAYLEEMVGKGKLPDILMHHKDNMLHHAKMVDHHNMMADKSEQVGDTAGFDHHTTMAMSHEMDHQHHKVRYDHAAGLKARSKAQKEMKAAKDAMDAASKKIADAKAWKRDA